MEEIARKERKTVAQVRADMAEAMMSGWNNPDPQVREMWKQIPSEGDMPTPEEMIVWAKHRVQNGSGS